MSNRLIGYETTFIVKPDTGEENQKTFVEKLKNIVTNHKGTVVHAEDLGRRKLAYPLQKETRGWYYYMVYAGDNQVVSEIERNIRINESVVRYLTIKIGDDFNPAEFNKKKNTAAPKEA